MRSLYESMGDDDFFETAEAIIQKQTTEDSLCDEKELKLKRVFWCLLSRN